MVALSLREYHKKPRSVDLLRRLGLLLVAMTALWSLLGTIASSKTAQLTELVLPAFLSGR